MSWIDINDYVPDRGPECHVVREWADGSLHTITAVRHTDEPLTINDDSSRNCWWASTSVRNSSFSDSTVVAWQYVNRDAPEFNGMLLPIEGEQ
ncbi:hypothetical protein DJ57_2583 [Yersinia rochesterensis]|nr:hypothetical protein DJ57_2583 [Yersinia rochesterensis]